MIRHEDKFIIPAWDRYLLTSRLSLIMDKDPHVGTDGIYDIYSLYFDDDVDTAYHDKCSGVADRTKFRLRLYNQSTDMIKLEKKMRRGILCFKESVPVTAEEAARITNRDMEWMLYDSRPLIRELYSLMIHRNLAPKSLVRYKREPFVWGNVRITFDSEISVAVDHLDLTDFTDHYTQIGKQHIMEIKYTEFLPDIIRQFVQCDAIACSFSKYENSRLDLR